MELFVSGESELLESWINVLKFMHIKIKAASKNADSKIRNIFGRRVLKNICFTVKMSLHLTPPYDANVTVCYLPLH